MSQRGYCHEYQTQVLPAASAAATIGVLLATGVVLVAFSLFGWPGLATVTLVAAAGFR